MMIADEILSIKTDTCAYIQGQTNFQHKHFNYTYTTSKQKEN